ncbi:MAG TPA: DsrE family protein [Chitinophagaceae bacterium]|nr:DsrE family protein [Chitinophagaceae bacterium]
MKNVTFILSLLFMTLSIQLMAKKKQHKIIFQFTNANDTMQQKAFVKQLENLNEFWPTANYEVVLYNQGLELVMKNNSAYLERLKSLKNKGVRFVVCENTLKNRKISKDVFVSELVEYIPAGIAEIVEKQEQGWSYIKGGF